MDLSALTASELSGLLTSGAISAVDALEACLDRYSRFNDALNAVIVTRLDEARQRARQADEDRAAGHRWGPLHGLPMTIKESFEWAGTPATIGRPERAGIESTHTALAVQRLLDAGAVIYGKTNVPINMADWQTFNAVYGTTNNPWDLQRVPGGSSGGAAAALATGMTPLELGSDIGASIRNPAHYCGVFGHKPSFGIVPTEGHGEPGMASTVDIGVAGPLARSAADLRLGLEVLAGPGPLDAVGWHLSLPEESRRSLADFRVGVIFESPCVEQDRVLTTALRRAVDRLADAGASIIEGAQPDIEHERAFGTYMMLLRSATAASVSPSAFAEQRVAAQRWEAGDRDWRALVGDAVTMTHRQWLLLDEERLQQRYAWNAFFGDYDLLLCPTAASTAFVHDHRGERVDRTIEINGHQQSALDQLFWAGYTCGVYLPATVVPVGLAADGLPCGIQIVGNYLHDATTIAYAALVEETLGGFVAPPLTKRG